MYDHNHAYIMGLTSNLFFILWNIPTVVGIARMGHGYTFIICVQLIVIYIHIDKKNSVEELVGEKVYELSSM